MNVYEITPTVLLLDLRRSKDHRPKRGRVVQERFIEVYEKSPAGHIKTRDAGCLELLPIDAPMPLVGDVIHLPDKSVNFGGAKSFLASGMVPFRVIGRESLYHRPGDEQLSGDSPSAARYLKTWLIVERVSEADYLESGGIR